MASDRRKPAVNNEATGREFCRVQDRSFEIWHAQELACWWGHFKMVLQTFQLLLIGMHSWF
jgi:hypothetical protein